MGLEGERKQMETELITKTREQKDKHITMLLNEKEKL
jgi:hypothetical protein